MEPNSLTPYTHAALVADAISLGPHWVYNQSKIARLYPDGVTEFTDPASQYHPNRKSGEFTHYGDQTQWLSDLLSEGAGYDAESWRKTWTNRMASYDGYIDGASTDTLASEGQSPSNSNDIAGASRIAPLLDLDLSLDETIAAARSQTSLTHGDPGVIDAAEFFVRSVFAIQEGLSIPEAFDQAAREGSYLELDAPSLLEEARKADPANILKESSRLGLTCHNPEAFPLTLYLALLPGANFRDTISHNGLAGGDTSARAMLLAILFVARDGPVDINLPGKSDKPPAIKQGSHRIEIPGPQGILSGVLEWPEGEVRSFALFAHCFTCGKDFLPEKRLTVELAKRGIATLRIDFSGLGKSEGSFEDTSFVTNLEDLIAAADWMRENHGAPELLMGHSLGGAAALAAAARIEETRAVVTIGAPADPAHVTQLFEQAIPEIESEGVAEVKLAGRPFRIGKRFLDDLETHAHDDTLDSLRDVDVLILHSPTDSTVSIDNAGRIYSALKHPKSFVSLTGADHLLTRESDAQFVADLVAVWMGRLV